MPHFTKMIGNRKKYPFLPHAVPEDLVEELQRFHSDPLAWWLGQIALYLLRPNERMKAYLAKKEKDIRFKKPIVG